MNLFEKCHKKDRIILRKETKKDIFAVLMMSGLRKNSLNYGSERLTILKQIVFIVSQPLVSNPTAFIQSIDI